MFNETQINTQVAAHLQELTLNIGSRPVGSENNHHAQRYIAGVMKDAGWEVEQPEFNCLDWEPLSVELSLNGKNLEAQINPFSVSANVTAQPVDFNRLDQMDAAAAPDLTGHIVVLHGELTKEPLFPKNFEFHKPEDHQKVIRFLESKNPLAIVAVSHQNKRPQPVIEDGDIKIPSITVPAEAGTYILGHLDKELTLRIESRIDETESANVIAHKKGNGGSGKRIVLCAHYDCKYGTPGGLDNAGGSSALMVLAQLLAREELEFDLELIAFNGEDYYSVPGQMDYLSRNRETLKDIALAININGVGLKDGKTSIAFFGVPDQWEQKITGLQQDHPEIERVKPWPQGDHSVFALQGIPALAFSSTSLWDIFELIHTEDDSLDLIDPQRITQATEFIKQMLINLEQLIIKK